MTLKNIYLFFAFIITQFIYAQSNKPTAKFYFNNSMCADEVGKKTPKLVGVNFTSDRFGNEKSAVFISGNEFSYINLGSYKALKPKEGSISLWVKLEHPEWSGSGGYYNPIIITKQTTCNDFYESYAIYYMLKSKRLVAVCAQDSTDDIGVFSGDFKQNEWTHLVMSFNSKYLFFYMNGKPEGKFEKTFDVKYLAEDSVLLGTSGNKKNDRSFTGSVDDIAFYDHVLTDKEVQELYSAPDPNKNKILIKTIFGFLLLVLLIFIIYATIKYRLNLTVKKEREKLELNNKLLETELRVNRASMNPHFLFNSLNALHNFILNNEIDNASDYLVKFSKLIRKILDSNMHESISLELEIELLELYLEIENLRFEENIRYTFITDDSVTASTIQIPIMMIQPFVENAIWHGLLNKSGEKIINISFSLHASKYIYCTIDDNGTGRKKHTVNIIEKKSLATGFVVPRLELLNKIYNLNCSLVIEDKPNNQGTIVKIILPILNR